MAEETRKDDGPGTPGPDRREGARDAIDRAAEEERRAGRPGAGGDTGAGAGADRGAGGRDLGGAAFPNPGGGGVLLPREDEPEEPARAHPDDGLGAGDALRGGAGAGPLPPGTGRPMPDPRPRGEGAGEPGEDGSARLAPSDPAAPDAPPASGGALRSDAADEDPMGRRGAGRGAEVADWARDRAADASEAREARGETSREARGATGSVSAQERAFGRDAAGLLGGASRDRREAGAEEAEAAGPFAADGPTAREADPSRARVLGADAEALRALGRGAGRNGWVLWVLGIAAIVAGVVALAMPLVASLAANAVVAAMLLASGAVGLVMSFRRRGGGGAVAMGFALSALAAATGLVMFVAPLAGIVALSTLIIAFFLASGAMRIWYGIRNPEMRGRGWLIASGALSIALAALLWSAFPGAALWLPGVLLAIDLILYGTMMIALAVFGRPKLDAERMG